MWTNVKIPVQIDPIIKSIKYYNPHNILRNESVQNN